MPTFPDFSRRLQEMNDPIMRRAADTKMKINGGIPRPRNLVNPMGEQPEPTRAPGVGRLGPENVEPYQGQLSTEGMNPMGEILPNGQPASGTGPDPTTGRVGGTMMDSLRQNVANQVRYEDLAPKMEEIPADPTFTPHDKHGFLDRVRAALTGAYAAQQKMPNNPYANIGGLLGGIFNPAAAERLGFETTTLPMARQEQDQVMRRNESRQKAFQTEIAGRTAVAKLNDATAPEYASGAGGENPFLYNKKDARDQVLVKGPDGQPMRNASVTNTEMRTETAEDIARKKIMADLERDVEKKKAEFEKARMKYEHDKEMEDVKSRHRSELEKYKQGQQNSRSSSSQAGQDRRQKERLERIGGRKRKTDGEDKPERASNVFQSLPKESSFEFGTGFPPTSGTTGGKRKQLPPTSGTGN